MASMTMSEPGTIVAATSGKAAEDGSAGTITLRRTQLRAAFETDLSAMRSERLDRDGGAEMSQHFLGVVARRLGLDHARAAGRVETGEKHRRFDLRRGDRRANIRSEWARSCP